VQKQLLTAILFLSAAILSGCQTPLVDEIGPLAIRDVSVSVKPTVKSVTDLAPPLREAANKTLVGVDPAGAPATVQISVDKVTYKDPLLSLLVGSANGLATTVTVTGESGAKLATFPHSIILDGEINGILGAAIAAGQDKAIVDQELVETYTRRLKNRIYGAPGHKPASGEGSLPDPCTRIQAGADTVGKTSDAGFLIASRPDA
jgi:hypothetical protein